MNAWRRGEMGIGAFIRFAKECGADGIEVLDAFLYEPGVIRDHLPSQGTMAAFLSEAHTALEETGIRVHAIAVSNDFNHDDNARLSVERSKIAWGIDLARELGSSTVRVFSGNPTSSDGAELVRYRTIDALKDLANADVRLALENHGMVFATPSRLDSLLSPLPSDRVGVCFDVGNFLLVDQDPRLAAAQLPPPFLVHVKDFVAADEGGYRSLAGKHYVGCRLGDGVVPIADALKVIIEKNGDRPLCFDLEMECGEDGVEATRAGVAWLRKVLAQES